MAPKWPWPSRCIAQPAQSSKCERVRDACERCHALARSRMPCRGPRKHDDCTRPQLSPCPPPSDARLRDTARLRESDRGDCREERVGGEARLSVPPRSWRSHLLLGEHGRHEGGRGGRDERQHGRGRRLEARQRLRSSRCYWYFHYTLLTGGYGILELRALRTRILRNLWVPTYPSIFLPSRKNCTATHRR